MQSKGLPNIEEHCRDMIRTAVAHDSDGSPENARSVPLVSVGGMRIYVYMRVNFGKSSSVGNFWVCFFL